MNKFLLASIVLSVFGTLALFQGLWLGRSISRGRESGTDSIKEANTCGLVSLWIASRRLGVPTNISRLKKSFGHDFSEGCSFDEIKSVAQEYGMDVSLRRIDWAELVEHRGTAILLFDPDHFVAVDCRERRDVENTLNEFVRLYDPNDLARWKTPQELKDRWSGETLLLSVQTTGVQTQPRLAADSFYADVGLLPESGQSRFEFSIANAGSQPLKLKIVSMSCSCSAANLSQSELTPGDHGTLAVTIDPAKVSHRFSTSILVETNDPNCNMSSFVLCGSRRRKEIVSSNVIEFGRLQPGVTSTKHIALRGAGDKPLILDQLAPRLTSKLDNWRVGLKMELGIRTFDRVSSSLREELRLLPGDLVVDATVAVPVDCLPGRFSREFDVITNRQDLAAPIVSLAGSVLSDLTAEPPAVILTLDAGELVAQTTLEISSLGSNTLADLQLADRPYYGLKLKGISHRKNKAIVNVAWEFPNQIEGYKESTIEFENSMGQTLIVPVLISWRKAGK